MSGAGAWSPEGEIYFTPDYDRGLAELNHIFPELLPGGRALLFTSFRMPFPESRIEALMVAPFDPETLRVTGPVLPARHEVAVSYADGHAEYALSESGILALIPRSVMPARREVVRLDRAGRAEMVLAPEKTYGGPALSPDGRQLLLTRNDRGLDVLLYDLERKTTTRLAASPRSEFGAVWAPSGTSVFYAADIPPFQIFEVETSGAAEPKRLLEGGQDQLPKAVSPAGRSLLSWGWQLTGNGRRPPAIRPGLATNSVGFAGADLGYIRTRDGAAGPGIEFRNPRGPIAQSVRAADS